MYRLSSRLAYSQSKPNPYQSLAKALNAGGKNVTYYDIVGLKDPRLNRLPYSIRILLESAVRNCDQFEVHSKDVENILNW